MLETLYATGMRVSELVALNLTDIDVNTGQVQCAGKAGQQRTCAVEPIAGGAAHLLDRGAPGDLGRRRTGALPRITGATGSPPGLLADLEVVRPAGGGWRRDAARPHGARRRSLEDEQQVAGPAGSMSISTRSTASLPTARSDESCRSRRPCRSATWTNSPIPRSATVPSWRTPAWTGNPAGLLFVGVEASPGRAHVSAFSLSVVGNHFHRSEDPRDRHGNRPQDRNWTKSLPCVSGAASSIPAPRSTADWPTPGTSAARGRAEEQHQAALVEDLHP